jgi:hypothetical protein
MPGIPFNTTTVTVERTVVPQDEDGYADTSAFPSTEVASSVRAVISTPEVNTILSGGDRIVYNAQMRCDPCDIQQEDEVTDDTTGTEWVVLNVVPQSAFALQFLIVSLRLVTGAT